MEDEIKQLYEAILKMNEKIEQTESKNMQLEALINAMSQYFIDKKEEEVIDQETVVLDPFNLGGYKNVSTSNGSVLRVKSKGFCVNGRHPIDENSQVFICSKCNGMICDKHEKGLSPPLCINCIKDEIKDLELLHIYILNAISAGISINELRKSMKSPRKEFNQATQDLITEGYLEKDLLFRKMLTMKGNYALSLGRVLYDLSFMQ